VAWHCLAFLGLSRGFEVVLFLQASIQVGSEIVLQGVALGCSSQLVGVLTFQAHKRLPHRQMLIATGVLLFVVLLVMVARKLKKCNRQAGWLRLIWTGAFRAGSACVFGLSTVEHCCPDYCDGDRSGFLLRRSYIMVWRKNKFA